MIYNFIIFFFPTSLSAMDSITFWEASLINEAFPPIYQRMMKRAKFNIQREKKKVILVHSK